MLSGYSSRPGQSYAEHMDFNAEAGSIFQRGGSSYDGGESEMEGSGGDGSGFSLRSSGILDGSKLGQAFGSSGGMDASTPDLSAKIKAMTLESKLRDIDE